MDRCPICGAWRTLVRGRTFHKCPPLFHIWCPDYGEEEEDCKAVREDNAAQAAELWADDRDSDGDYAIVGGSSVTVHVRAADSSELQAFHVTGESAPEYHASEVEVSAGE